MRNITVLLLLLFSGSCYSQQSVLVRDTINVDSLIKRIDRLERNQTLIVKNIHAAGKDISTGATLIGVGAVLALAGTVVGLVSPKLTTAQSASARLNAGQIAGIILGTAGVGVNIAGIATLATGGKTMKEL